MSTEGNAQFLWPPHTTAPVVSLAISVFTLGYAACVCARCYPFLLESETESNFGMEAINQALSTNPTAFLCHVYWIRITTSSISVLHYVLSLSKGVVE